MSENLYFKVDDELLSNFITPLNSITDKALIKIDKNKIKTVVISIDPSVILIASTNVDTNITEETKLGIGNVKKLKTLLNYIDTQNESSVYIKNNKLTYKSDDIRFSYHLMDENLIKDKNIVKAILDLEPTTSFTLTYDKIRAILKTKSLSPATSENRIEKIYFKFTDGKVYVEFTDKTLQNCDTIEIIGADNFVGETNVIGVSLPFQIIAYISQLKKDFFVNYNSDKGIFKFEYKDSKSEILYIISEYSN